MVGFSSCQHGCLLGGGDVVVVVFLRSQFDSHHGGGEAFEDVGETWFGSHHVAH